jgi:ATP-dependent exoDNAse (exonuclease V) alpha subunit
MNDEQQRAFEAVKAGKNIFLTGPAGTGKSYVINEIKKWAVKDEKKFTITALTGCASVLIGGRTLHSALGLGIGDKPVDLMVKRMMKFNKEQYKRLQLIDLLVIDEVSMMSDDVLEKASAVLSIIRNNTKPFGGVQVILAGDMCQLGPVSGKFCFLSPLWYDLIEELCMLSIIVRQSGDTMFLKILHYLRKGKCTKKMLDKLIACQGVTFAEGIKPTRLHARRANVEKINKEEYDALIEAGALENVYTTRPTSPNSRKAEEAMNWAKHVGIPMDTKLCIGAQVVVTSNIDQNNGIINGTRGVVIDVGCEPIIKLLDGREITISMRKTKDDAEKLEVEYIPLKYAWCLTVHSAQGMTLDAVEIDLGSSIFAHGQAYTALSRVKNMKSVRIINIDPRSFIVDPCVKALYGM